MQLAIETIEENLSSKIANQMRIRSDLKNFGLLFKNRRIVNAFTAYIVADA